MTKPKRFINKDKNHDEIVETLRRLGISVTELHEVGDGIPDIVCGYSDENIFIEIKNPSYTNGLTPAQKDWHSSWKGQKAVCRTPQECVIAILKHLKKINYSSVKVQAIILEQNAQRIWGEDWKK